jgi:hypothetical protein
MTKDDLDEPGLSLDELVARETEIRALHSADWSRWIAAKFEQTWWRYADVLLWIAFRSPERMAETLAHSYEPKAILRWYEMSAGDVAFHALQAIQNGMSLRSLDIVKKGELRAIYKPDVVETKPDEALRAALRRGAVRASGALDGAPPRQIIDSDQWNSLDLPPRRVWIRRRPTVDAAYTLAVPDILERGHWFDLCFDRESVIAAFPRVPPDLVSSIVPVQNSDADAWRVQAGETCKAWMARPEVSQEAARRLRDGGTGKTSIPGVLTLMARECGAGFSQENIRKNVKVLRETT